MALQRQSHLAEVRADASLQCAAFGPGSRRTLVASANGVVSIAVNLNTTSGRQE